MANILFIHDVDDWSFHNIGRNIAQADAALGSGNSFRLMSRDDWAGRPDRLFAALEWADLHLFFWRFDLIAAIEMLGAKPGRRNSVAEMLAARITLSVVYDHLYSTADELIEMGNPFAVSDLNAVCSGTLALEYAAQPHLFTPDAVLIDGVDLDRFHPAPSADISKTLRVGWVGNSDWGMQVGSDMKGFHRIFRPAMDMLQAEGLVTPHIADRATNPVPPENMPQFYRDIDVLVCTSMIEGTPNPVLEAMASGAAVISTDVGVVRDVCGPLQRAFIIPRTAKDLTDTLRKLVADRDLLARLQAENLARRTTLSWLARHASWQAIFDRAQQMQNDPDRIAAKRAQILHLMSSPKSRLARTRRHVLSNRYAHGVYSRMQNRYPGLLARVRNLLR